MSDMNPAVAALTAQYQAALVRKAAVEARIKTCCEAHNAARRALKLADTAYLAAAAEDTQVTLELRDAEDALKAALAQP